MDFRANMNSLSVISDEYSHSRISREEYRCKRTSLLKLIDKELNGVTVEESCVDSELSNDDTLIDKALSFLKLDKIKETN